MRHYLPDIGSGYATATVQAVLDMNVVNDYSEDYGDPFASVFLQEAAMGWRLPGADGREIANREFVRGIRSADVTNRTGFVQYKSSNTDVIGEIVERVGGRPLRDVLIDIVEAAGLEGTFHIGTDRAGTPIVNGGACVSARDLARYALLFVRGGRGVGGREVGSRAFIETTLTRLGVPYAGPRSWQRYSNHTATGERCLGHGGYGGQYMLANPDTGSGGGLLQRSRERRRVRSGLLGRGDPHGGGDHAASVCVDGSIAVDHALPVRDEPGTDEVVVEAEKVAQPQLVHDGETRTVDPAHAEAAIAQEELPGTASSFGRGLDEMTEPTTLDGVTERHRLIHGPARLEQRDGLRQNPLGGHEAQSLGLESPHEGASSLVMLITAVP